VRPVKFMKMLLGRSGRDRESPTDSRGRGLRAGLSVEGLFAALDERRTRYVVLRWFDRLPAGDPDGDIDMLVHDDDVGLIADLFTIDRQAIQCDVFSVSGLPGTSYRGMPYLPKDKAIRVLERATRFEDTCLVPSVEDHFMSLAYHAVYQKGLRCGLPTTAAGLRPKPNPRHDYAGTLGRLAKQLRIDVPITMEGLDSYLTEVGWRPDPEVISKLAKHNEWLAAQGGRHSQRTDSPKAVDSLKKYG
jgi:hypothetical protein